MPTAHIKQITMTPDTGITNNCLSFNVTINTINPTRTMYLSKQLLSTWGRYPHGRELPLVTAKQKGRLPPNIEKTRPQYWVAMLV